MRRIAAAIMDIACGHSRSLVLVQQSTRSTNVRKVRFCLRANVGIARVCITPTPTYLIPGVGWLVWMDTGSTLETASPPGQSWTGFGPDYRAGGPDQVKLISAICKVWGV